MTRVLTALVLIAVVVTTLWRLPPWTTVALSAIAAALATHELTGLSPALRAGNVVLSPALGRVPSRGFASGHPFRVLLAASSALFCIAFAVVPQFGASEVVAIFLMVSMLVAGAVLLAKGLPTPATVPWAIALMACVYVGLPLGALSKIQWIYGPRVLTVLLILVVFSDSAQYYTGRTLGRRKLAP